MPRHGTARSRDEKWEPYRGQIDVAALHGADRGEPSLQPLRVAHIVFTDQGMIEGVFNKPVDRVNVTAYLLVTSQQGVGFPVRFSQMQTLGAIGIGWANFPTPTLYLYPGGTAYARASLTADAQGNPTGDVATATFTAPLGK